MVPWAHLMHHPNGISIMLAIFAEYTVVPNRQLSSVSMLAVCFR